ncbi:Probable galactose-1-phosphate uridylyltransferase GalTb [second part] [Mycobacterium tuberculosis]|nr:Probable galactose-1-phosphate uridylyltransferase GalTb [second part] [Mycobacterium tuberculosis]
MLGGERDNGAPRQRNRQRETQVVIGVFADQVDPPGCAVADRHGPSSRSRVATLSGITSAMNASIADVIPESVATRLRELGP